MIMTIAVSTGSLLNAQVYTKGDLDVSAGIGFGNYIGGGLPVSIAAEYGISRSISVGGTIGHAYFRDESLDNLHISNTFIGARASWHVTGLFNADLGKWDPYAGLQSGYNHIKVNYGGSDYEDTITTGSGIYFGWYLGSRLMLSDQFGLYTEFGYGISILQFGMTAKF